MDISPIWQSDQLVLTVKPIKACNFNCIYCFQDHCKSYRMSLEIYQKIIGSLNHRAFRESPLRHVTLYLHGGEPLLTGVRLLTKMLDLFSNLDISHEIIIISNLSLMTKEIAHLLIKHKVLVCTSLDGPKELNDFNRMGPKGSSAFEATIRGLNIYREAGGIPMGINCTLTRYHLNREEEIYKFFKSMNIPFQVNHALVIDDACTMKQSINSWSAKPEDFGTSMVNLLDLWLNDPEPSIDIINFRNSISLFLKQEYTRYECATVNTLCFDPNSNVYPCPSFSGCGKAMLGTYDGSDKSLDQILIKRESLLNIIWTSKRRGRCEKCRFSCFCEGVCTLYGLKAIEDNLCHDMTCGAKQMLFARIEEILYKTGILEATP